MFRVFIAVVFFSTSFSFSQIEKCDFVESIELIGCVTPILDLVPSLDGIGNMTRARVSRIKSECKNTSRCLSGIKCAANVKLDKNMDVLCDAFHYFSADFFECQRNITRINPPCIREVVEKSHEVYSLTSEPKKFCNFAANITKCFKEEVVTICGEKYWTPIDGYLTKIATLGHLPCKLNSQTAENTQF